MSQTSDPEFWAFAEDLSTRLRELHSGPSRVADIQVIASFTVPIRSACFWLILDGPIGSQFPAHFSLPTDEAVSGVPPPARPFVDAAFGVAHSARLRFDREPFRFSIGFEEKARVDAVGTFYYFR